MVPSRAESYGMVVGEALARGLPVLASRVGGLPDALGRAPDGTLPGVLLPPDDPAALTEALARWLDDPHERDRLARAAASRRPTVPGWDRAAAELSAVLARIGGRVATGARR